MEVSSVNVARLLSELEGCSMFTRKMGFLDDADLLDGLKAKYYKKYFELKRKEQC